MKVQTIQIAAPGCYDGIHRADHIETWYDRSIRSWTTARFCADGNQMGSSDFDGTKADRDATIAYQTRTIGQYDD